MSKSQKGVTLIEITVTLLISSMLLIVGVATLLPIEKRQLEKTAKALQDEIRYIQRMSIANKTEYRIFFDLYSKSHYYVFKRDGEIEWLVRQSSYPKGIALFATNAENGTIGFTKKGTIEKACTILLVSGKYNVAVTCAVGSGDVSIKAIRPRTNMYSLDEFN